MRATARRMGGWADGLRRGGLTLLLAAVPLVCLSAQSVASLAPRLAAMTAVSGYERAVTDTLLRLLPGATRDRLGNVVLSLGTGDPRRLVYCDLDEAGYVVGRVTPDGLLRLRRVGRVASPLADQQIEGQRVTVWGRHGAVPGVVAVNSIHLSRSRAMGEQPFSLDDAWVDVGAASAEEITELGIDVLAPVALVKRPQRYGDGLLAAPAAGARAACAALLSAAAARPTPGGSVVVAFAVQTLQTGRPGVAALSALHGPFTAVREATLPVRYRGTAVETVALDSAQALAADLAHWIGEGTAASTRPTDGMPPAPPQERRLEDAYPATPAGRLAEAQDVVAALVERYGVSGDEGPVRDAVAGMLPAWAKPTTDSAGNLWLKAGTGEPLVAFVAHLDEIGYRVDSIRADGTLALSMRGGFFPSLFEGQAALVHTPRGDVPGVFLPRDSTMGTMHQPRFVSASVGAASAEAAAALGVAPGQSVTMPKSYARLAGTRATGRSFDDRVGAASLVLAARHLNRALLRHAIVFIWSTREEIGLEGARAAAATLGTAPVRVHAIDTFVSADSPLEPQAFALAPIGKGAVARALDNSSVTPAAVIDTLARVARARGLALQIGTTNGGNDGSMFVPYGVVDVPIGWPLRYSHSPAEVIDLKDLVSLAEVVRAIAEEW
ncbi:MAG TPA: M20/M25/M40 family metallo-hydrolase [Gemmatimonadales bacterium]|nr:M20/M25/M40 family metallo-hydrolase [Gemmatimonadales bacterium]